MADEPRSGRQSERPSRPMTGVERFGALALGILLGGFGFLAMFITENEAGTAIALLLGGVLILVGLQGTQVLKLGKEGGELARREILSERVTDEAEERPDVAQAMIEAYEIADPRARNDPVVARALDTVRASQEYQRRVAAVLREAAAPNASVRMSGRIDGPADLAILSAEGNITIELVFAPDRSLRMRDIERARRRVQKAEADAALIITNSPAIYPDARRALDAPGPSVEVVQWTGTEGARPISAAVDALREHLGGPATSPAAE
jgi:hypothetical protein